MLSAVLHSLCITKPAQSLQPITSATTEQIFALLHLFEQVTRVIKAILAEERRVRAVWAFGRDHHLKEIWPRRVTIRLQVQLNEGYNYPRCSCDWAQQMVRWLGA